MSWIKRAKKKKKNQFKQKPSFQREKEHVERFSFSLLQTFHSRKRSSVCERSVIEVEVLLQNLKVRFGFVSVLEN